MILEAKNVSFAYRRRRKAVLQNVSLTVESGEITGLFAPSGYGKTTLCRLLAGYEKPDSGFRSGLPPGMKYRSFNVGNL